MMARILDVDAQQMYRDLENERMCEVYVEDPQVFAADEILDIRAITTEIEYYIKWTGYSAEYNEWVAEKHVTPDLKREFSIGKKKDIQLFKCEKAKARVMRKKHGKIGKSSNLALASPPFVAPSISRTDDVRVNTTPTEYDKENGTSLSVTMSVEFEAQIPEWTTSKDDSEESDVTMSETSSECDDSELEVTNWTTPKEDNAGCDTLMSTASSKSGESDGCDATMSETSSVCDESELEVPKWTVPKQDNEGSDSSTSDIPSEFNESGIEGEEQSASTNGNEENVSTMFETSSVCDESELEVPKWTAPKQDNEGSDTSTSVIPSEFDESGIEKDEQNASTNGNEENGNLVSATLSNECTTKTTRRESDQNSVVSMTLVAESESEVDSFQNEQEPEKYLLGFNEQLEPVFTYV
ncbi:hypothetical protein HA402_003400 [Bradysia odoriphaga]|nr:hypothetical protein HA402_003400 [Bradysia odoriphaga]